MLLNEKGQVTPDQQPGCVSLVCLLYGEPQVQTRSKGGLLGGEMERQHFPPVSHIGYLSSKREPQLKYSPLDKPPRQRAPPPEITRCICER